MPLDARKGDGIERPDCVPLVSVLCCGHVRRPPRILYFAPVLRPLFGTAAEVFNENEIT